MNNDLVSRCREIVGWCKTGLLKGDALRDFAERQPYGKEDGALQIAERVSLIEAADTLPKMAERIAELEAQIAKAREQEPVAVVGEQYSLWWAGSGPIAPLMERHGVKAGSNLYARPIPADPVNSRMLEALERIANPINIHFAGDAQVVARDAIAAAESRQVEPVNARLLGRISDAMSEYERSGEICTFEGQPMIYAYTLVEIAEIASEAQHAEPVRLTDEQIETIFYPSGADTERVLIARSVGRTIERCSLRANGYKIE